MKVKLKAPLFKIFWNFCWGRIGIGGSTVKQLQKNFSPLQLHSTLMYCSKRSVEYYFLFSSPTFLSLNISFSYNLFRHFPLLAPPLYLSIFFFPLHFIFFLSNFLLSLSPLLPLYLNIFFFPLPLLSSIRTIFLLYSNNFSPLPLFEYFPLLSPLLYLNIFSFLCPSPSF